jgi:hypothetical protein
MAILILKNGTLSAALTGGSYDGEKIPGDLDLWMLIATDPNAFLIYTYGILVQRSSTLYHTYPFVRSAINKQVAYAVGPGLLFRSQPDYNYIPRMSRTRAKDWGKDFQKIVHYYFQEWNVYEKQSVLLRSALILGDAFLYFLREAGKLTDVIEFGGDSLDCLKTNETATLGIEHDSLLRKKAIWKTDGSKVDFQDANGDQVICQLYFKELCRQLRGYPLAYSIIHLAKNDDRHTDATVQRAVMESIMMGSFKTETSNPIIQSENMANANIKKTRPLSNLLTNIGNAFKLGAGNMYTFKKGEEVSFTELKTPSGNYGQFKEWLLNYVAAATDTPPEVILSKYSTSYTAHRGALNDFQKSYMMKRDTFGNNIMRPLVKEILKMALLNGQISAPGFFEDVLIKQAYLQGSFLGPIPGTINPVQEVGAAEKSVKNGFELRSDIAARYGNEWDNLIENRAAEEEEFRKSSGEVKAKKIIQQELQPQEDEE